MRKFFVPRPAPNNMPQARRSGRRRDVEVKSKEDIDVDEEENELAGDTPAEPSESGMSEPDEVKDQPAAPQGNLDHSEQDCDQSWIYSSL